MKKQVISRKNLPDKLPSISTLCIIMALDYWKAPGWLWGGMGLLLVLLWISAIWSIIQEKQVNIFGTSSNLKEHLSSFNQKLKEMEERKSK